MTAKVIMSYRNYVVVDDIEAINPDLPLKVELGSGVGKYFWPAIISGIVGNEIHFKCPLPEVPNVDAVIQSIEQINSPHGFLNPIQDRIHNFTSCIPDRDKDLIKEIVLALLSEHPGQVLFVDISEPFITVVKKIFELMTFDDSIMQIAGRKLIRCSHREIEAACRGRNAFCLVLAKQFYRIPCGYHRYLCLPSI